MTYRMETNGLGLEDFAQDEFEEAQEICDIPVEVTYSFGSDGEYYDGQNKRKKNPNVYRDVR